MVLRRLHMIHNIVTRSSASHTHFCGAPPKKSTNFAWRFIIRDSPCSLCATSLRDRAQGQPSTRCQHLVSGTLSYYITITRYATRTKSVLSMGVPRSWARQQIAELLSKCQTDDPYMRYKRRGARRPLSCLAIHYSARHFIATYRPELSTALEAS